MKRQLESEQIHRLSVKTLDQVFVTRAREGLGCSLFEAQALTELVKDVYFPWLTQPEAIQAEQITATSEDMLVLTRNEVKRKKRNHAAVSVGDGQVFTQVHLRPSTKRCPTSQYLSTPRFGHPDGPTARFVAPGDGQQPLAQKRGLAIACRRRDKRKLAACVQAGVQPLNETRARHPLRRTILSPNAIALVALALGRLLGHNASNRRFPW